MIHIFCVCFFLLSLSSNAFALETGLFSAVEKNSQEEVLQMLRRGYDIEEINKKGNTPLLHAAEHANWEMLYFLAQQGADVKAVNRSGKNALFYAAGKSEKAVDFLLRMGLDPNVTDISGHTPFHSAFSYIGLRTPMDNKIKAPGLEALICAGTDFKAKNVHGNDEFKLADLARRRGDLERFIASAPKSKYASAPYSLFVSEVHRKCIEGENNARKEILDRLKKYMNGKIVESLRSSNSELKLQVALFSESCSPITSLNLLRGIENEHAFAKNLYFLNSYIFINSEKKKDKFLQKIKEELPKYRELTNSGHADSFYLCGLANVFLDDHKAAVHYFKEAAKRGSVPGKVKYASYLISGIGVAKDFSKAFELLSSAAETGYADAAYLLAFCYEKGIGTTLDATQAFIWARYAAVQDHIKGMAKLAEFYKIGFGVEKNDLRSSFWADLSGFLSAARPKRIVNASRYEIVRRLRPIESKDLFHAVRNRSENDVDALLKKGCDLEARNEDGETPLLYAANRNNWQMALKLIRVGANVDVSDKEGRTILMQSMALSLPFKLVKLLAAEVCDHKALDKNGRGVLHYAVKGHDLKKVELALNLFENIDHQDKDGMTAFAHSTHENTQLLFSLGANPFISNRFGDDFAAKAKWLKGFVDPFDMQKFVPYDFLFTKKDQRDEKELTLQERTLKHIHDGRVSIEEMKRYLNYGYDINKPLPNGNLLLNSVASRSNGKHNTLSFMLSKGADPNNTDFHGQTALFHAAKHGDSQTVALLLKHGSSVSIRDKFGHTPLFYAAADGDINKINLLLKKGADVNVQSGFGETPLMWAAYGEQSSNMEAIKLLLAAGANINSVSNAGITPLWCAVYRKDFQSAKFLIESGADINVSTKHRIVDEVIVYKDFITYLLEKGLDPEVEVEADSHWIDSRYNYNYKEDNPIMKKMKAPILYWAAQNGVDKAVKLILSQKININKKSENDETALIVAIDKNHQNIIKMLIDAGADVTIPRRDGQTPLIRAAKKGLSKIVKMLIAAGAVITPEDFDKFIARDRNVKILKKRGIYADLESVKRLRPELAEMWGINQDGTIKEEHLRVEELDKAASDMNAVELSTFIQGKPFSKEQLNRALHFAAERNSDPNVLKLLVEKGADVNDSDKPQQLGAPDPVIFSAVLGNKVKNVEMLITLGADIHKLDNQDEGTLLHSAASLGYVDIVKVLLRHGCDKNVEDHYGSKAIDNARANKKDEIVKLLSK